MKLPGLHPRRTVRQASTMSLGFAGKGQLPGHGREDDFTSPAHQLHHRRQVHFPWWWPAPPPRSGQNRQGAYGSSNSTVCDALLVDDFSRSDTYPHVDVREDDVSMAHGATVSKISEDQLFYLMSRGLTEEEARGMIVRGFVEPISS